jgi:hypothetical protein
MSTVGSVNISIKWDNGAISQIEKRLAQGLFAMGADVATHARNRAPVADMAYYAHLAHPPVPGLLKGTIRVDPYNTSPYVVFVRAGGIGGVKYARRREFENNLHPQTKHYMSNGLKDTLSGNWQRFFKGRIK